MSASRPSCHHLQPTGKPCGSPALRGEQFCFYHHPTRRRPRAAGRKPRLPAFHLPTLADRASIQRALAKVVSRVIGRRLDPARARLIVSCLQFANETLPGDPHQLGAFIQRAQLALVLAPAGPLPDFLQSIRPPRPSHKKCTESKANHFRNIT
jgi:hypothetical protein